MRTATGLFYSSMVFGIVIAVAYGITTKEVVGTVLLGMMAFALFIVGIFIHVAEREAGLSSDDGAVSPQAAAGETLGVFSLESYWPGLAALGLALVAAGITFLPGYSAGLLVVGVLLLFGVLRLLVREST